MSGVSLRHYLSCRLQDNLRDLIRCSPWNGRFCLSLKNLGSAVQGGDVDLHMCRLVDSWNGRFSLLPGSSIS